MFGNEKKKSQTSYRSWFWVIALYLPGALVLEAVQFFFGRFLNTVEYILFAFVIGLTFYFALRGWRVRAWIVGVWTALGLLATMVNKKVF